MGQIFQLVFKTMANTSMVRTMCLSAAIVQWPFCLPRSLKKPRADPALKSEKPNKKEAGCEGKTILTIQNGVSFSWPPIFCF